MSKRTTCSICGKLLDNPDDPKSLNCGGDCLQCMEEIEDEDGDVRFIDPSYNIYCIIRKDGTVQFDWPLIEAQTNDFQATRDAGLTGESLQGKSEKFCEGWSLHQRGFPRTAIENVEAKHGWKARHYMTIKD